MHHSRRERAIAMIVEGSPMSPWWFCFGVDFCFCGGDENEKRGSGKEES